MQTQAESFNDGLQKLGYQAQLDRRLSVWQLTAFGLNYMIPLSPAIFFGFLLQKSGGTVSLPFLLAGIAIFFTAMSYIVMVRQFPLAGSLYHFVARAWHPKLGCLAGWALLLDYLLITTVTSMSAALYIHQLLPHVAYAWVFVSFVLLTGAVNLFGIKLVATFGLVILLFTETLVLISFVVWGHAIVRTSGLTHLFSLQPFHFHNASALLNATSLAVASYLGFDAITTLAEEAKNPVRDIPRAIIACVLIGGVTMFITGYLVTLLVPHWQSHLHHPQWVNAALFYVAKATGGTFFALFYSIGFIISMAIFNVVATAATARLLFGMGRDNQSAKVVFAKVSKQFKTPYLNVCLILCISIALGLTLRLVDIANLVNYGALFGFGLLNLAVIRFYFKQRKDASNQKPLNKCQYLLLPAIGFIIIAWVFCSLDRSTLLIGSAWLAIGIAILFAHAILRNVAQKPVESDSHSQY